MVETWKQFEDTDYEVSNLGKARKIGTFKNLYVDKRAHSSRVEFQINGKRKSFVLSTLVATLFLPPKKDNENVVRHLDNDLWNNCSDNLSWYVSKSKYRSVPRKLTLDEIDEIRLLFFWNGVTAKELAKIHNVCTNTIHRIVKCGSVDKSPLKINKVNYIEGEIWLPVVGFEGFYEVSNMGRVKSLSNKGTTNIIKATTINNGGYVTIRLAKNKKEMGKLVHRLVAEAFIPNPDNKATVNHIDSNRINNNLDNLEWTTYSENLKHAFKYGSKKATNKKLTDDQVNDIRNSDLSCSVLGKMFNVAASTINKIKLNKRYKG